MEQSELQSGSYEMIDQNQVILSTAIDADLELWQYAEQTCSISCTSLLFRAALCSLFGVGFCFSKTSLLGGQILSCKTGGSWPSLETGKQLGILGKEKQLGKRCAGLTDALLLNPRPSIGVPQQREMLQVRREAPVATSYPFPQSKPFLLCLS